MIVVTGLRVTDLTYARIVLPNPGYFVSIRTTPPSATNTVVTPLTPPSVGLARPPVTMKRLSLTFSSRMSMGLCCAPTTAIVSAAIATRTPSVVHRLMASPPVAGKRNMDPNECAGLYGGDNTEMQRHAWNQLRFGAADPNAPWSRGPSAPERYVAHNPAAWTPQFENYARIRYAGTGSASSLEDRKSTRLNSSHVAISYAVFCLKKKN